MILYSPAKINIGLHIIARRPDGFHDLQSVMYPVGLSDILEIRETTEGSDALKFSQTGITIPGGSEKNLCEKAHEVFTRERDIPPVEIHLHKQIPVGAGLGGGSSNASLTLLGLNQLTSEPVSPETLHDMAASLGSDCPFFLHKNAMMMEGRGEILSPSTVKLDGLYLVLLFPDIHISTPEAYSGVKPQMPAIHLEHLLKAPVNKWKGSIVNDFEKGIFEKYPKIAMLKEELYHAGALYASLSGSGSSIYGIFPGQPDLSDIPELPDSLTPFIIWKGEA